MRRYTCYLQSLSLEVIIMKLVLLFVFIVFSGVASAQPYKSIFGSNSTMWIIKWYNLDFGGIDTIVVEKDTLAYGFIWKKIILTQPYGFFESGALIREDTLIGKVWYHPLEQGRDSTYLAFDFALESGETFDLSSNYDPWSSSVIVSSTDTTESGKRISFNSFIEQGENITFIEGMGGNQGPIYKESSGFLYPYLLCAYKDGIQTYSNISYGGNCDPPTSIHEAELTNEFVIHPNPFQVTLYINNLSGTEIENLEVFDPLGKIIYSSQFQSRIDLPNLATGLYYLRLMTNRGQILSKPILHE